MKGIMNYKIVTILLLLLYSNTILSQESEEKDKPKKRPNQSFVFRLSEQDVILPITSIEWGHPDRWSFTSRYIHGFEKERKRRTWINNIGVSLSPGLSGGRLGVNYLGIYSPASLREFALFSELRGVILRTWGNPLSTNPNTTFAGAEIKICLSWLLNTSIGYYSPITKSNENIKPFWGFHFGIGI
jgi:hypothetical protein